MDPRYILAVNMTHSIEQEFWSSHRPIINPAQLTLLLIVPGSIPAEARSTIQFISISSKETEMVCNKKQRAHQLAITSWVCMNNESLWRIFIQAIHHIRDTSTSVPINYTYFSQAWSRLSSEDDRMRANICIYTSHLETHQKTIESVLSEDGRISNSI